MLLFIYLPCRDGYNGGGSDLHGRTRTGNRGMDPGSRSTRSVKRYVSMFILCWLVCVAL